jgi:hypothetical protein
VNWIRISVALADDPKVHRLADTLGVRVAEAAGLLVFLLGKFPEHAPTGDLSNVPASLVERWAGWEGERGAFDRAFRAEFLNDAGVWEAWDKHNGKALQKLTRDRERVAAERESRRTVAGPSRDGRGYVAGTDGRTDELLRGRSRALNGNGKVPPAAYVPAQPIAPVFCPECGPGQLATVAGQKRPVRTHLTTCPRFALDS